MTIMDGLLVFDQDVAITVTRDSTNVIDLGVARDLGVTDDPSLKLLVQVTTPFAAGGAATLTVTFNGSPDNATYTVMASTAAIPVANLVAGARLFDITVPRPVAGQVVPRYLKLNYAVATGPFTAGKINSSIVLQRQDYVYYPPGVVVSN